MKAGAIVLLAGIGGLAYMDAEEPQIPADDIARCLSGIEAQMPVEEWTEARTGAEGVSIRFTTRIRGGLMRRRASCMENQVVIW